MKIDKKDKINGDDIKYLIAGVILLGLSLLLYLICYLVIKYSISTIIILIFENFMSVSKVSAVLGFIIFVVEGIKILKILLDEK